MLDPARLAAFTLVTGATSLVPGPQMLFVMTQAAWRGPRAGMGALAGLQIGNLCWFVMAGLGLGALATASRHAFTALAVVGALYLAWLGVQAIRDAGKGGPVEAAPPRRARSASLRDSLAIALSNPKSLVYVLALLPPFVDPRQPVAPQLAVLAAIAVTCDFLIGSVYVAAGSKLAAAMQRPALRARLEWGVGAVFLLIAAGVLIGLVRSGGI
ncbi:LysE family translocator [Novosphingobium sp. JCM 18896]|uniref:LysE family translocator n=1 Tax=Novosphingobium sp. JCM 18896 TaxID=2989731 RepID=UPI0022217F77|nr:LysE family translocator [Novosphingobium sp. JCM 18896]MCW1429832.1 LysE family translocator [Novosphingobium sp. JCM 18896]